MTLKLVLKGCNECIPLREHKQNVPVHCTSVFTWRTKEGNVRHKHLGVVAEASLPSPYAAKVWDDQLHPAFYLQCQVTGAKSLFVYEKTIVHQCEEVAHVFTNGAAIVRVQF